MCTGECHREGPSGVEYRINPQPMSVTVVVFEFHQPIKQSLQGWKTASARLEYLSM